jgi:hypothetical protein
MEGSEGNAGSIEITLAGLLQMLNIAVISSSTQAKGDAGEITISASQITLDSSTVGSIASDTSTGSVGNIDIQAESVKLLNSAKINIKAHQMLSEAQLQEVADNSKTISLDTGQLILDHESKITSESTGNVPAGAIEVNTDHLLVENGSKITTSARQADGGPINIHGGTLVLRDGQITTSVTGESGDGGTITLTGKNTHPSNALVLENGFVQANTAASDAHGGYILVNARAVIANNDQLLVGGETIEFTPGLGFNIIQAAAPGGEQGNIDVTAPELDIAASLVQAEADFSRPSDLATDPCSASGGQGVNALVRQGQGGMRLWAEDLLDLSWNGNRLDRLIKTAVEEETKSTTPRLKTEGA